MAYAQTKGPKEAWCQAANDPDTKAVVLVNHYAKCVTIDPKFCDTKNLGFGISLVASRISVPIRWDWQPPVRALAMTLLTTLSASIGKSLGLGRLFKSNTGKARSHFLFRQGCILYELHSNTSEHRLVPLMPAFAIAVTQLSIFSNIFVKS